MSEGLMIATLTSYVGKKNAVRYGGRRVTLGAVGHKDGEPFALGKLSDGSIVCGLPSDFSIPKRKPHK